jgi:glycosyltransferase involved in cell wall biosynthesis
MLEGDLKWGALAASDLLALPSHSENFGMVVAEALAVGTPVLISNRVNIWREVESGGGGVVTNADVASVTTALERWYQLSDSSNKDMRQRAKKTFHTYFDITANVKTLTALLQANAA